VFRLSVAACLVVCGCVSLSDADCRAADWYQRGSRDGLGGMQAQIDIYSHQCAAFGVKPDDKAYMTGWREGYAEWNRRVSGARM